MSITIDIQLTFNLQTYIDEIDICLCVVSMFIAWLHALFCMHFIHAFYLFIYVYVSGHVHASTRYKDCVVKLISYSLDLAIGSYALSGIPRKKWVIIIGLMVNSKQV